MTRSLSSSTIVDYEQPRLVPVRPNLYAACFFLMKLLPARFMLDRAEDRGELAAGGLICESTSGTFGLALAMLAATRGYRLVLVSDPVVDDYVGRRITALGARLDVVTTPAAEGGFQRARLDRLAEIRASNPGSFWPSQYHNPDNPNAYALVAEQIVDRIGRIDCLIGAVGSGGSMSGTVHYLRQLWPELVAVAVDTPHSVLFGQPDGPRPLRGLGNSLIPANLEHALFDEVHWVSAAEAFVATRRLYRDHALFMGPTSGAAYLVADWWARRHPHQRVVVLCPDEGHRYMNTVYQDAWLAGVPGIQAPARPEPPLLSHPSVVDPSWSRFVWRRRALGDVVARPAVELAHAAP